MTDDDTSNVVPLRPQPTATPQSSMPDDAPAFLTVDMLLSGVASDMNMLCLKVASVGIRKDAAAWDSVAFAIDLLQQRVDHIRAHLRAGGAA